MQNRLHFCIAQHLHASEGWGQSLGYRVQADLRGQLMTIPRPAIVHISLAGLKHADVSFCRGALIDLAAGSPQYGFCLINAHDADLLENWRAVCLMTGFPLLALEGASWEARGSWQLLGPQPPVGLQAMYQYAQRVSVAKTTEAAKALGIKIANASNKLHQLWQDRYLLRQEQSALGGGIEHHYVLPV